MWLSPATSRRSPRPSPSQSESGSRPVSPGATLAEALRKNAFRNASKDSVVLKDEESKDDGTKALNEDLFTLANFFPDVKIEVLRELLSRFDGDSRLPICTEQLYKYKVEWARGRNQVPPRDLDDVIPLAEQFRSKEYSACARQSLATEFRGLSRSVVDAVLAEVNFSYSHARPTLQVLSSKSWRYTLTNLFRRKKPQEDVPLCLFEKGKVDLERPKLLASGSNELDLELRNLFLRPIQTQTVQQQVSKDLDLARNLNQEEAEDVGAIFECQVCCSDFTFEDISTCTENGHVICLECVRRSLQEAIFGQGWAKSVDVCTGTLRCLAPSTDGDCLGVLQQDLVQRAVLDGKSGKEMWSKFEERIAEQSLQKSGLPLIRCPFCSYAEADQNHDAENARQLGWQVRKPTEVNTFAFILLLEILPCLFVLLLPIFILFPNYTKDLFYTSLGHLTLRGRTTKFICHNPECSRKSCLKCSKAWHDPHTCHEPLILSLRRTIESARTAAIKRTCPRCGTSFVKLSGCNKLTCVCGYSMCYLCRRNIGKTGDNEGAEGYRHFCEHFRPTAGQKCTECEKCDLYKAEDEDFMVKRAGEEAERLWREREGMVGVKGLEKATGNVAGEYTLWSRVLAGDWTVQDCSDFLIEKLVVIPVV